MKRLLDFILPPQCASCGTKISQTPGLCPPCWEKLHFISEPQCVRCGYPFEIQEAEAHEMLCIACAQAFPPYHQLRAVCRYDEASKPLLMRFKHGDATHLASLFVQWLAQSGQHLVQESDVLLPVPLHWRRLMKRGYNQAGLLAQGLSRKYGKTFLPDVLRRKRHTSSQGTKSVAQRAANVSGVFEIPLSKQKLIEGKTILLIDDVYASGATIRECVKVLKHHQAHRVDVLTIARVVRPETLGR
ncbi:MAG: ComF family protein [Caedimonas sp.]|nr:ComF family protein [Caedimonas sp.]